MYREFAAVATMYPGWGLKDIKQMTGRERVYWYQLIKWRMDRSV